MTFTKIGIVMLCRKDPLTGKGDCRRETDILLAIFNMKEKVDLQPMEIEEVGHQHTGKGKVGRQFM